VALGASDTFGAGADNPYTENWPSDLTKLLKAPTHLINLGIPSMTLQGALTTELPIALDEHPQLITIWLAVNDLATHVSASSYSNNLDLMLIRLQKAAPQARIAVGNVPNLSSVPAFGFYNQVDLQQQIALYNMDIAEIVSKHHAILVDLSGQGYDLRASPQYISDDGLHPSTAGYQQLAKLFYQALQKG
jgi:lysophospholipase L1-like esterase